MLKTIKVMLIRPPHDQDDCWSSLCFLDQCFYFLWINIQKWDNWVMLSCSVMSGSLRPHGLQPGQVPLSMELSRQEYWSRLLFLTLWDIPNPEIEPVSFAPSALAGGFFTTAPPRKPQLGHMVVLLVSFWLISVLFSLLAALVCIPTNST